MDESETTTVLLQGAVRLLHEEFEQLSTTLKLPSLDSLTIYCEQSDGHQNRQKLLEG